MAWKAFEDEGGNGDGRARLLPSGNRDRLVDCMEEFVKFTLVMRPFLRQGIFDDRFSERNERSEKAEKQKVKDEAEAAAQVEAVATKVRRDGITRLADEITKM